MHAFKHTGEKELSFTGPYFEDIFMGDSAISNLLIIFQCCLRGTRPFSERAFEGLPID